MNVRPRHTVAVLVITAALGSCRHGQTSVPADGTGSTSDGRISLEQLQQEMIAFTSWHNGRVKAIAEHVRTIAPDERVRYEALRLMAQIIQTQNKLLVTRDPRDAFTDSWVYVIQRRDYLTTGATGDIFALWHDDAARMTDELEAELKRIGGLFMTPQELAQAEAAVEDYAREHPTLGLFEASGVAPSVAARQDESNALGAIINVPLAPFSAMQGVDTGVAAMNQIAVTADRLTAVAADLPEQTRWQAELFQYDMLHREPLKTTFEDFHRVSESMDRISDATQSLPEDVRKQVEDAFEALDSSSKNMRETLLQVKETADALTATADSAEHLVQSAATLIEEVGGGGAETAPPKDPEAPSEFEQLTTVAQETRSTVEATRELVADLNDLLRNSKSLDSRLLAVDQAAGDTIDHATDRVRGLIRFGTLQGLLLIGVAFVAAILYRVVVVRVVKPR